MPSTVSAVPLAARPSTAMRTVDRHAWIAVAILTLTQVVSYVDRYLPSLLVEPLKHDLGLSDFQIGLLLGPAFGVFYVAVGVPIGWLADRVSRRSILSVGVAVWCCMTAAGAFARSFAGLAGARLGVGLGEATVAPCAVSLISDYFSRERRARPMALFMAGSFIGAGSAFLFGGPFVHWLAAMPPPVLPGVGPLRPWQAAFLLVGLPGLLLSLLMLAIREPLRAEYSPGAQGAASLARALRYMAQRWRAFGTLFVGSCFVVASGSFASWNASLFQRTWGWSVRDMGVATGLLFFTAGPIGTFLAITLSGRGAAAGRKDATMRTLLTGLAIAAPAYVAYPLMPSAPLAIACLFAAFAGQAIATASGPASLALIAPGELRSQATAVYYLVISVAGQLIGPPPIGWMTDAFGDPHKLRYAISIEAVALAVPALLLVSLGLKAYRAEAAALEARIGPAEEAEHG